MSQLFQSFNRLGQEGSAEEGTGIGLVVTKRLVELMGAGSVSRSTVGRGSTFWFELLSDTATSLVESGAHDAAAPEPLLQGGARLRSLLYVEDNPANLQLVVQIIARRPDLRLLSAKTGLLGIEIARASQPDVILMDINLPGMNGIEAMQILRADTATAHIPVVALSANAHVPATSSAAWRDGFFRYLTKPLRVDEFLDTLDVALAFAEREPRHRVGTSPRNSAKGRPRETSS